jgi:hypothetical protein
MDASHKDDEYIGYLSLSKDNKIIMTPKVYLNDKLKLVRVHNYIIHIDIEEMFALSGDGYLSIMEGPLPPDTIKILSPSVSKDKALIIQGRSPIELRVYDSQGNVSGLVHGEIKEELPNSTYDDETNTVRTLTS